MSMNQDELAGWVGHTLVDQDGDKIGKIADIYADDATGQPEWIAVDTGRFGTKISFVPLSGASAEGDDLKVPFGKSQVSDAPKAEADGHLSQDEEQSLYSYYGLDYGQGWSDRDYQGGMTDQTQNDVGDVGHDTSGPTSDDAMTRSEEELRVGTENREAGRVRLRKYVVTEQQTQTVPVSHEEVRIEREPITDENVGAALDGPDISEEEHEVVLHEERPVVAKETVAKERVRLDTETVTEQAEVSEEVRKERIDTDGVDRDRR
jgi:uncharacterized protein (TIGR02271 family)